MPYKKDNNVGGNNSIPYTKLQEELDLLKKRLQVETNRKNNLYAFILREGLFYELQKYSSCVDMSAPGGLELCMDWFEMQLPENQN